MEPGASTGPSAMPRLHGVITPLVTPLADRDTLDHAGLDRLLEHVLSGGVHGLFLLGTTGEAVAHSYKLRRELVRANAEQHEGERDGITAKHPLAVLDPVAAPDGAHRHGGREHPGHAHELAPHLLPQTRRELAWRAR